MAIKALERVIVDTNAYEFRVIDVEPKRDFESGEQKANSEGVPAWTVDVMTRDSRGNKGTLSPTIYAMEKPDVEGPAVFEGLEMAQWKTDGKAGVFFQATAVYPA